jgi:hypothetical protein
MKAKTQLRNRDLNEINHTEGGRMTAKLTLRDLLTASLGTKRKIRVGKEGSIKCKGSFTFGGRDYFDCTSDKTPDGSKTNQEWCMLEDNEQTKKWDYCKPDMNFDKIRQEIQRIISKLTVTSREMQDKFDKIVPQETALIQDYQNLKNSQADLTQKVSELNKNTEACKNGMEHLTSLADEWNKLETKSVEIAIKIEDAKKKLKFLEEKEEKKRESHDENSGPIQTPEEIKKESENTKMLIADWIQHKEPFRFKDCKGMLNYEEPEDGKGIFGHYFNNPGFKGSSKKRLDATIKFEFTGASPLEGINSQNFSIMWDGYIQAPIRSKYTFAIETEGGVEVFLSGKKIISHRMYSSAQESKNRSDALLQETINNRADPSNNNYNRKTSEKISLSNGDKYRLVVKYYHSVHDYMYDNIRTYIKLSWYTDEIEESVIPTRFLYDGNQFPAFKLSGLDRDFAVSRKLNENDLAFKDSVNYVLQDIPTEYRGNPTIKLPNSYKLDNLEFISNIPINVFIAKINYYPRPFPGDFENMGQYMSILEVAEPADADKRNLRFEAKNAALMGIYKKKYAAGKIKIPLDKKGLGKKGNPLVVFFGIDNTDISPYSCGGNVEWISQPSSEHFNDCTESSKFGDSWSCMAALDGSLEDHKGKMWASNNEGVGAFIKVNFKNLYEINSFTYKDKSNKGEQNKKLLFEFSSGDSHVFEHIQSDDEVTVTFDTPFRSTYVKVTILDVYGTINNGGAFKFFGTDCSNQTVGDKEVEALGPITALFDLDKDKVYNLGCLDSNSSSKKLFNANKSPGSCSIINCFDSCYSNPLSVVYGGTNLYAKDSSICKSAVHSGFLSTEGGRVLMCYEKAANNLAAEKKYGIQSKPKEATDLTIKFNLAPKEAGIESKVGVKFDYNESGTDWAEGIVTSVDYGGSSNNVSYTIVGRQSVKSYPAISLKSPRVAQCGNQIKGRDCRGTTVKTVPKINIRFAKKDYHSDGSYLKDYGQVYGTDNKPYGWTRDMQSNIKVYDNTDPSRKTWSNYANIIESYVEFPPAPKSKFCSSPMSVCDKATYNIKTGDGKFTVRIFIEVEQTSSMVNMQVNGKSFAKKLVIKAGERKVLEENVDAQDGMLEIDTECTEDCFLSKGVMNMIQIFPYTKALKEPSHPLHEGDVCDGLIRRGKPCEDASGDVTHCAFQDRDSAGFKQCTGSIIKVKVPKDSTCLDIRDWTICIKQEYDSSEKNTCDRVCTLAGFVCKDYKCQTKS